MLFVLYVSIEYTSIIIDCGMVWCVVGLTHNSASATSSRMDDHQGFSDKCSDLS